MLTGLDFTSCSDKEMLVLFIMSLFRIALSDIIVNTNSGPVQGVSSLKEDVEAFLGIPYAEPPIEELRFAKPVPKQWTQILNASNLPPACPQPFFGNFYYSPDLTNMSEDCLYLNIWAPKSKPTHDLRPVVIYIHFGGFTVGSSSMKVHDGSRFASKGNLIVVTINYRIGALGFFYSGNEVIGGNMGMYDQVMAIKWMKQNAQHFGGDPDNIVLMGSSAGAFSVTAHMLSPLSMNLFNKVIIQSGTMLHPYYSDNNTGLIKSSKSFSSAAGCSNRTTNLDNDPESVVECLKIKPIQDIIEAERIILQAKPMPFLPMMNSEFLPDSTTELLRAGKFRSEVDVLMGVTKDEGTILIVLGLAEIYGSYGENAKEIMTKDRALATSRIFFYIMGLHNSSEFVNYYLGQVKGNSTIEYLKMLSNIVGDYYIRCGSFFFAEFLSVKGNSVYFYEFGFRAASTPMAEWVGTTHTDELQYVFGNPYHENFTAEETELSHRMIDRWSSFARTGDPNIPDHVPWLRYNYHNPLYMSFDQEEESLRLKSKQQCKIWRKHFNAQFDPKLIQLLKNL